MTLLLSMPGGSEWILIFIVFSFLLIAPILAITFYSKNKKLSRDLDKVNQEKEILFNKLLEKTN